MKPGRISDDFFNFLDFQTFHLIFYAISYDETIRENLLDQTKKIKTQHLKSSLFAVEKVVNKISNGFNLKIEIFCSRMLVPRFAFICCCCCTHAVLAKKFGAQPNSLSHFHDDNLGINSNAVGFDPWVLYCFKTKL